VTLCGIAYHYFYNLLGLITIFKQCSTSSKAGGQHISIPRICVLRSDLMMRFDQSSLTFPGGKPAPINSTVTNVQNVFTCLSSTRDISIQQIFHTSNRGYIMTCCSVPLMFFIVAVTWVPVIVRSGPPVCKSFTHIYRWLP
jgi:hypothetical protein